ncbi:MAG TPA: dodecin domain-containing protein [Candidatus Aminicenantes bacterium]|nr:dodecin domain-containing protein [Candidatus Aminicenantes bacterium]
MSTVKVIELIGASDKSWEDAAANAVREASETVSNIVGVEVTAQTAKVSNSRITEYRSTVKVAFRVKADR